MARILSAGGRGKINEDSGASVEKDTKSGVYEELAMGSSEP